MKSYVLLLLFITTAFFAKGQSVIYQRADSVIIMKQGGYAELVIRNRTKDSVGGVLTNAGNGVTTFKRAKILNDSLLVIGGDTLHLHISGSLRDSLLGRDDILAQENRNFDANNHQINFDSTSYFGITSKINAGNQSTIAIQPNQSIIRTIGGNGTTVSEVGTFVDNAFGDGSTNGINLRIDDGVNQSKVNVSERYVKISSKQFSLTNTSGDTVGLFSSDPFTAQSVWDMSDLTQTSNIHLRPESIQFISPSIFLNSPLVQLSTYGLGTHFGTKTYGLAVDASGNVIEDTTSGSGSAPDSSVYFRLINASGIDPYFATTSGANTTLSFRRWRDSVGGLRIVTNADSTLTGYVDLSGVLSSVNTTNSVTGDGTSGTPVKLVNDAATPGNSKYYGTDGSGTKGFFTLPSGLPSGSANQVVATPDNSSGVASLRPLVVRDLPATKTWPAQTQLGTLFYQDQFTNAFLPNVFVNASGGTNSSVLSLNNKLITSASSAAYTNYNILFPSYYTMVPHLQYSIEYRDSIGGNGFAMELRDPSVGLVGYLSGAAGASTLNLLNQSGSSYTSGAGPTIVIGHDYRLTLTLNDTTVSLSAVDITAGGSTSTITKTFSPGGGQIPRVSNFAFFAFTGTYCISKIQISSTDTKNPNLVFIGDSKTREYTPTTFNRRYADQLGALYPNATMFAATAMKITDILLAKDELGIINGQKFVIHIGSNDLRPGGGYTLTQAMANLTTLVNYVLAGGGQPIIIMAPEDSTFGGQTVGLTAYKNAIAAAWSQYYVDIWTSMTTSGDNRLRSSMDAGDHIHFNQVGHDTIVAVLVRSGALSTLDVTRRSQFRTNDGNIKFLGDSLYVPYKIFKRAGFMPTWDVNNNLSISPFQFNGTVGGYNSTKPFVPTGAAGFTFNEGLSLSGSTGGLYLESRNGTVGTAVYSLYVLSNLYRTYNNTRTRDLDLKDSIGRVLTGIGKAANSLLPSAWLDFAPSDGTAGNAPIKIRTGGTLLTTPEDGALEYNGTHWYGTIGSTRYQLDQQSVSGVTTVGSFSGSSQTNGASISSNTITFGPADASNPGMVSTGTQTIAGAKTFNANVVGNGLGTFYHYISGAAPPTLAGNTGSGSGSTLSVTGTDQDGVLTVTTGTGCAANATIVTATYTLAFITNSFPTLTPANSVTAALSGTTMVYTTGSQTTFTLTSGSAALTDATTYKWYYHVGGN